MARLKAVETLDVRFPTSRLLEGSDAVNVDPDYSAAYVVLSADDTGIEPGHGFTFTIGRGNEICVEAIRALGELVVGLDVEEVFHNIGGFARRLTEDSQFRWLGPEKGVVALAAGALVNAAWDMWARHEGKPVWKLLSDLTPEQVVELVDWRYLGDCLTPDEALTLLHQAAPGKSRREEALLKVGYPAYTTSPGWLGYSDEKMVRLCRQAVHDGFRHVKLKVGRNLEDDVRRCRAARSVLGPEIGLMVDANQAWDVDEAIIAVRRLEEFGVWWVEEPTSPDDILGAAAIAKAVAPVQVASGEHVHNRVMFKQFLASGGMGVCQIDACRVAGVNENVAILLLAHKYGVAVCPHAGGVGLCELVQHLSMFDFVAVSGQMEGRVIEYVDSLHEHFLDPVVVRGGRYRAPTRPGFGARMRPASLAHYLFPDGPEWSLSRPPVQRG